VKKLFTTETQRKLTAKSAKCARNFIRFSLAFFTFQEKNLRDPVVKE